MAQAIQPVRQQWPMIYIIHYTDDVLMAGKDPQDLPFFLLVVFVFCFFWFFETGFLFVALALLKLTL